MTTTVKLSEPTIALMDHFANMNQSLLVDEEIDKNRIRSVNAARSATVFATIPEQLPSFQIYDLKEFLACISALQTKDEIPTLEFDENYVVISNGSASIKYFYCDQSVIRPPADKWPKNPRPIDADCRFTLSKEELAKARKIASTIGLGQYVFETHDGKIHMTAIGEKDSGISNVYRAAVGDCEGELSSEFGIRSALMQLFPADYDVILNEKGIAVFSSELNKEYSLTYYISPVIFAGNSQ